MDIHIELWFCCLNANEKAAFSMGGYAVGAGNWYVRKDLFDAIWLIDINGSILNRKSLFIDYHGMSSGTIPDGDGGEIEVYFLDPEVWYPVYLFTLTDAFLCPDPCPQLVHYT